MADEAKTTEQLQDEFFAGKGTQEAPSASEEPTGTETTETKPAETDSEKTGTGEVKEEEIPKEFHKNPAWQRIIKERNDARVELEKLKGSTTSGLKPEDVERFNQVVNSPEYIRASMKAQGYKDEAIDAELTRRGFEVEPKGEDDINFIARQLNVKPEIWDDKDKAAISDVAKVARLIARDEYARLVKNDIEPVKEYITGETKEKTANRLTSEMERIVKEDGILDFDADVSPAVLKFMDDNKDKLANGELNQYDVFNHFKDIYHQLSIERLKTGKRKEERDGAKLNNRPSGKGERTHTEIPKLTGDTEADMNNWFAARKGGIT